MKKSKIGIFASPEEKKKAYIVLSFITLVSVTLGIMTTILPVGAYTTTSFILNYFTVAFALLLVYSLFTSNRQLVLPLSGYVAVASLIFIFCNYKVNYQKDYHGVNPQDFFAVLIAIMFFVSMVRFIQYKTEPKV